MDVNWWKNFCLKMFCFIMIMHILTQLLQLLTPIGDWDFRSYCIPTYSPDYPPSDYQVFGLILGMIMRSKRLCISGWRHIQNTLFYNGIKELIQGCEQCSKRENNYIRKWFIICICNWIIIYKIFHLLLHFEKALYIFTKKISLN